MSYRYKKDFLGKWMKKKGITSYALMDILHLKSTNNIDMWAGLKPPRKTKNKPKEDQEWLPLLHIIRLCNHYPDLKFSDFIENAEEPKTVRRRQRPTEDIGEESLRDVIEAQRQTIAALQQTVAAQQETIRSQREAMETMGKRGGRPLLDDTGVETAGQ